jgi:hypothetical protein
VEAKPTPYGMGSLEASRDSKRKLPRGDITKELRKIKLPKFFGGRASEHAEAWLEGMKRCFTLRDYASTSKENIMIFQLRDNALNWWGNLESHLHLTLDTPSHGRFLRKVSGGNIFLLTMRNNR